MMKKILILAIVASGLLFTSCEADSDNVSKVTKYANMSLNGDALVVLTQGETYTEQGANAEAGGQQLPVKTAGTVDTSKPSMYKVSYSAINSDGFPATITRTIVVLSNKPTAIDLTGTFLRNGNPNVVTKLDGYAGRRYICDNATGYNIADDMLTMEFYNIDDKQIYAPYTENASKSGISAESNIGTITNQNNWSWVIYASAVFGDSQRIFKR